MAQKTQVILFDDLDPSGETGADETVQFGFRGQVYEIDLSKENLGRLEGVLEPFINAARKVTASRAPGGKRTQKDRDDSTAARAWLKTQPGVKLSERGRIPAEYMNRWRAAGSPRIPAGSASPPFQAPHLS